jgi:HEAT repeat protein
VALAERLRLLPDEEVLTRLVELSQGDPSPLVRALCFDAFAERGAPGSARALARTLLTDTDPRVVVRAAGWLGEEAADRLAAFRVSKDTTVRTLAVRCTARLRNAVKLLVAHQATQGDSEVVALALAETGDPAAEAPLIALLSVPGDVGVAAARGLGLIGTARAIPALFALGTPEAKAAIAQIHLRIPDAGEGRISIAEGGGELSVTEAGGELSVAGGAELSALLPEQDEPTEHSG